MTGGAGSADLVGQPADLVDRVRRRLASRAPGGSPGDLVRVVRAELGLCGAGQLLAAARQVSDELVGAGRLQPLLRDPRVTDVLVNGPDEVWVDGDDGLRRTPVRFPDDEAVRRLACRLVTGQGGRLDDAVPFADVRLADGSRLHAVLAPLTGGGTCLSLRVPRRRSFRLAELRAAGSVDDLGLRLLTDLVVSRAGFVVSGGTGSGKTTLLAALLSLVGPAERLVLVEEVAELRPTAHAVRLTARPANAEGAGGVPLRVLVRQALRMRPDRLVLGECRGPEVVDLLAALNTGHDGGATTLHADRAAAVPARLEALAATAGLPRPALHAQLAVGIRAVVHLRRDPDGRRRLAEFGVLRRGSGGWVRVQPVASWDRQGRRCAAPGRPR